MKTVEEILKTTPVYLNSWSSKFEVVKDFEDVYITIEEYNSKESPYPNKEVWLEDKDKIDLALVRYENINILFASYGVDNYSGDAWVLFEEDGKLYEVNGSHCSCYGLEGQWVIEEVVLKELENRLIKGTFGQDDYSGNEFSKELKEFLDIKHV